MISIKDISSIVGCSLSHIARLEKMGEFPARRQIGSGRVGWLETEILKWIDERPKAMNHKESRLKTKCG
ncbi:MAG: transcriptional regulator [Hyphomicrobium sp.]|nr:MAG: transcriptional regulator [Hyphomicrobium sp.]